MLRAVVVAVVVSVAVAVVVVVVVAVVAVLLLRTRLVEIVRPLRRKKLLVHLQQNLLIFLHPILRVTDGRLTWFDGVQGLSL